MKSNIAVLFITLIAMFAVGYYLVKILTPSTGTSVTVSTEGGSKDITANNNDAASSFGKSDPNEVTTLQLKTPSSTTVAIKATTADGSSGNVDFSTGLGGNFAYKPSTGGISFNAESTLQNIQVQDPDTGTQETLEIKAYINIVGMQEGIVQDGANRFVTTAPSKLTINDSTRDVSLEMEGAVSTATLNVTGVTTVKLSDFGISVPSNLSDEATFTFFFKR